MGKEETCHLSIGRGGVISQYSGRERRLSEDEEKDNGVLVNRVRDALKSWKRIRLGIKLGLKNYCLTSIRSY